MDKNEITPINRDFLQGVSETIIGKTVFRQFDGPYKFLQEQIIDEDGGEDE